MILKSLFTKFKTSSKKILLKPYTLPVLIMSNAFLQVYIMSKMTEEEYTKQAAIFSATNNATQTAVIYSAAVSSGFRGR